MKHLSGRVLALALVGALCVLFATYVGLWWVANQMAWWTYGLLAVGCFCFWQLVKATFQTIRNK